MPTGISGRRPGMTTPGYGLIGYPLDHSFSPRYFAGKFRAEGIQATYTAFPLERIADLPMLLMDHPELRGLNVTTPHKESVLPFLHALHPHAAAIGAVNCIHIDEAGKRVGYNTDWESFHASLEPLLRPQHTMALILGSGGAARSVGYALRGLGIPAVCVSRRRGAAELCYEDLTPALIRDHGLIINATPAGTAKHAAERLPPFPFEALTPDHLLYDLVYNPPLTDFLRQGAARGAAVKNGQEMLELQAEASWTVWRAASGER